AVAPHPLSLESVGIFLELSLGLSAWKEYGPDRWALRCNPSSGNLHPTEGYVVCRSVADVPDGVYHYVSRDHILEQRCRFADTPPAANTPRLLVALSSIHWREAWKYGERAFRYCQLDTGHAIGAPRYAAAALGWRLRGGSNVPFDELAAGLGLDRNEDFSGAERDAAGLPLQRTADPGAAPADGPDPVPPERVWHGRADVLDQHPMYRWAVIDDVEKATRPCSPVSESGAAETYPPKAPVCSE